MKEYSMWCLDGRTTASDVALGIPFHFRSWSKMNQMKRDDPSLDRLCAVCAQVSNLEGPVSMTRLS